MEYPTMRKLLILLALAIVTVANLGCCGRCRNLFRRGSPCCGTALARPPMLRNPIPLGAPFAAPQARQVLPQAVVSQPGFYQQCEPCPSQCVPCCEPSCNDGSTGYISEGGYVGEGDCGCQTGPGGQYFGGYLEGSAPPQGMEGAVIPGGSSTYPGPVSGN